MKVLMINSVSGIKSTGRICTDLSSELTQKGHTVKIAYGKESVPDNYKDISIRVGSDFSVMKQALINRIWDNDGLGNVRETKRLLEWVEDYNPDVIHIHNLHSYYINYQLLFDYIKANKKKVIWTFHDCWAFTGHCSYFDYANCNKWMNQCFKCPQKKEYPTSYLRDQSRQNYNARKNSFTGVQDMTIVTPSKWLAKLVAKSYLKDNKIIVINNGIDTTVFCHRKNNLKEKLGIADKKVVLGVANPWHRRKGLKDILVLSTMLPKDYQIVLVGLNEKQMRDLPPQIIGMMRTNSTDELANMYSMADVYINPTYEDNYPTTNIEALSCLTPVVTYNTGGSPESASLYGSVVQKGDIEALRDEIINCAGLQKTYKETYVFSKERMIAEYMELYNSL